MQITGKINETEFYKMEQELIQYDKADHRNWTLFKLFILSSTSFFMSLAVVGAIHMIMYGIKTNLDEIWPQVLLCFTVIFTIAILCFCHKYRFDPYDWSWPKTYRYFMLTRNKHIIRDVVALDTNSGHHAALEVVVQNSQGTEEKIYVGSFDVELTKNVHESVLDLKKERLYVPYTANDIEIPVTTV